jgi:hypothetical protein
MTVRDWAILVATVIAALLVYKVLDPVFEDDPEPARPRPSITAPTGTSYRDDPLLDDPWNDGPVDEELPDSIYSDDPPSFGAD